MIIFWFTYNALVMVFIGADLLLSALFSQFFHPGAHWTTTFSHARCLFICVCLYPRSFIVSSKIGYKNMNGNRFSQPRRWSSSIAGGGEAMLIGSINHHWRVGGRRLCALWLFILEWFPHFLHRVHCAVCMWLFILKCFPHFLHCVQCACRFSF